MAYNISSSGKRLKVVPNPECKGGGAAAGLESPAAQILPRNFMKTLAQILHLVFTESPHGCEMGLKFVFNVKCRKMLSQG